MKMEMTGFSQAYNNMLRIEAEKKYVKQYIKAKVDEVVKQGLDREVAKVMFQTMYEYGTLEIPECGFVEA